MTSKGCFLFIPTQQLATQLNSLQVPNLDRKKSVHFLTTSTSITTLPNEKVIRLRPELNTLLSVLIKQNRSSIKLQHHIEIPQSSIESGTPPQGLRQQVNPQIPDNKNIHFLIKWDQVTTEAALSYIRLLLKHWENVLLTSTENISNIESRIETQQATEEEWKYIREAIDKVKEPNQRRPGEEAGQTKQIPSTDDEHSEPINILSTTNSTTTTSNKRSRRFKKRTSIVNLSKYKLNKDETSILEKGLNFIPTPTREHKARIIQDFLLFERKLRLHHMLHKEETNQSEEDEESSEEEEPSPNKILRLCATLQICGRKPQQIGVTGSRYPRILWQVTCDVNH